jgi:glycosyltransferase involved in cell wall biosynthesis
MRILLVVPMVPQADGLGAIPKLLHAQLLGLSRDHDVTVVGTFGELPGQAEAAASLAEQGIDAHFADRRRSGSAARRWQVRLALAGRWASRPWPWRAVSLSAGLQAVLDEATAGREFDVVSVEDGSLSVLRLPEGVPVVLTEHEVGRAAPNGPLHRVDWKRWGRFQRRAWGTAALVQVYSRADATRIEEIAPDVAPRLRVDPFGMALPAIADPALEQPDTLLFAGTFTHPPNRDAALWLATEIMPAVRARRPEAVLRIVGTVPPREILALVRPGVEVLADAPSIEPHLAAASVVIAPVRSGGGMRLKVLEALAAGRAVVTTSLGTAGFTELDREPPISVADTAEEMAAATAALLEDPGRRRALGSRARELAERHYSPEAWATRLGAVYKEAQAMPGNPESD